MKRAVYQMSDGSHINVPADRLEKEENMICAYNGRQLVAAVDVDSIIEVHIGEKVNGK